MTAEDREKLDDLMLELRRLQEEEKLAEEDLQKIRACLRRRTQTFCGNP